MRTEIIFLPQTERIPSHSRTPLSFLPLKSAHNIDFTLISRSLEKTYLFVLCVIIHVLVVEGVNKVKIR